MPLSLGRRQLLASLLGVGASTVFLRPATASTAVALTLDELVGASHRILLGTPEETVSRWEIVAGARRIVSYTRLIVDEDIDGDGDGECQVRTLGGEIGEFGELVNGEAQLRAGDSTLVFLRRGRDGAHLVTGRAQGHYPLRSDRGVVRLRQSPVLPELLNADGGAVRRLVGRTLTEARAMVRESVAHRR
jgi:hypothetical protein